VFVVCVCVRLRVCGDQFFISFVSLSHIACHTTVMCGPPYLPPFAETRPWCACVHMCMCVCVKCVCVCVCDVCVFVHGCDV
jgi:hypothetical protein